jgi:hypothetical protein
MIAQVTRDIIIAVSFSPTVQQQTQQQVYKQLASASYNINSGYRISWECTKLLRPALTSPPTPVPLGRTCGTQRLSTTSIPCPVRGWGHAPGGGVLCQRVHRRRRHDGLDVYTVIAPRVTVGTVQRRRGLIFIYFRIKSLSQGIPNMHHVLDNSLRLPVFGSTETSSPFNAHDAFQDMHATYI